MSTFTAQDAQLIFDAAQAAPLQNMKHAGVLGEALQRGKDFLDAHFFPQSAAAAAAPPTNLPPISPQGVLPLADVLPPGVMPVVTMQSQPIVEEAFLPVPEALPGKVARPRAYDQPVDAA